jgi:hypothetical protein
LPVVRRGHVGIRGHAASPWLEVTSMNGAAAFQRRAREPVQRA